MQKYFSNKTWRWIYGIYWFLFFLTLAIPILHFLITGGYVAGENWVVDLSDFIFGRVILSPMLLFEPLPKTEIVFVLALVFALLIFPVIVSTVLYIIWMKFRRVLFFKK
jgi:hypothetical protein